MAALVEALDMPTHRGENGHVEYGWSSDMQEELFQLSFQFTRSTEHVLNALAVRLGSVLKRIVSNQLKLTIQNKTETITFGKYQELMITAYKMIGHTRDIIDGKGEYSLSYMQIVVWHKFFPELAKFALRCFVQLDDLHPYGSWKDIKYFCNYCINCGLSTTHPLVEYALELITDQMKKEQNTLVAKWIPREKSKKFGWIFDKLAQTHFKHYLDSARSPDKKEKAAHKARADYRKLIAKLNVALDTVQIKQCGKIWSQIDHSKTTSITMMKQKKAFLNLNSDGTIRSHEEDRIKCGNNLTEFIKNSSKKDINGKRIGLNDFTKEAIRLLNSNSPIEIDLLNSQWRDNGTQTSVLGPMIAMVDISGSMLFEDGGNPYYSAVALGCRVAEKSILGKRILTFSEEPTWHNLDMCDTFTSMVQSINNGQAGYSTNFYKALNVVLNAIVDQKLTAEEVNGMVLVVFSDMQMDLADKDYHDNLYENIKEIYAGAGIKVCGTPYKPPHILFWNLRSTDGFPCMSNQKNVSMMSGFSPALLNHFCEKGVDGLQTSSPWVALMESMNNPRYKYLEDRIKEELNFY